MNIYTAAVPALTDSGLKTAAVPLWMSSEDATADIAAAAVELVTR